MDNLAGPQGGQGQNAHREAEPQRPNLDPMEEVYSKVTRLLREIGAQTNEVVEV
jgi:hypothetical protein